MYHSDGLGSVAALSQWNTASLQVEIVERYRYDDVFGRTTVCDGNGSPRAVNASAYGNPILFTGRRLDVESGLYDYRARIYSPALGRFLQPDPIGYTDGMNLYAYVSNNPLNWIDPWGLLAIHDEIAEWAEQQEGNMKYDSKYDHWFWGARNRCNIFVRDAVQKGTRGWVRYPRRAWKSVSPPSANEIANRDFNRLNQAGFDVVGIDGEKGKVVDQLQRGDIIAFPRTGSGHAAVYIGNGRIAQASP